MYSISSFLLMLSSGNLRYLLVDLSPPTSIEKFDGMLRENSDYQNIEATGKISITLILVENIDIYIYIYITYMYIYTIPIDIGTADCDKIAQEYRYKCHNGKCLHRNYICDKVNHCGDESDEMDCRK